MIKDNDIQQTLDLWFDHEADKVGDNIDDAVLLSEAEEDEYADSMSDNDDHFNQLTSDEMEDYND